MTRLVTISLNKPGNEQSIIWSGVRVRKLYNSQGREASSLHGFGLHSCVEGLGCVVHCTHTRVRLSKDMQWLVSGGECEYKVK